jgi:Flp pilus assembly protein CpaB
MKSRGLVVAIAVVLAVLAAVGVIVYTSGVRENAITEGTTAVLVSTQDIQANTPLDPLISQGVFQTIQAPNDGVVPDAVTDVSQLQGQTATAPIYQNEQIPTARISGGPSNILGIDEGNIGVGLQVDGQAAVNGYVQQGDNITIYATFPRGTLVTKQTLRVLLTPAQLSKTISQALSGTSASGAASANVFQMATDFTVALVPAVEVLSVQNPPVDTTSGRAANGSSMYVLNMVPDDAQELIFATEHATIYIGLLPPGNEAGYAEPGIVGVPLGRVIGVDK